MEQSSSKGFPTYQGNRLPTKTRLAKFFPQEDTSCTLYKQAQEDETHLFFTCPYAQEIWRALQQWWYIVPQAQDNQELLDAIQQLRTAKTGGLHVQLYQQPSITYGALETKYFLTVNKY